MSANSALQAMTCPPEFTRRRSDGFSSSSGSHGAGVRFRGKGLGLRCSGLRIRRAYSDPKEPTLLGLLIMISLFRS